ncbi:putative tRNA pseudouridine synthase Pus10 [Balamuthia mandrillaris]
MASAASASTGEADGGAAARQVYDRQVASFKLGIDRDIVSKRRVPVLFELLGRGCCKRCCFRFINEKTFALYRQPDELLGSLIAALYEDMTEEYKARYANWRDTQLPDTTSAPEVPLERHHIASEFTSKPPMMTKQHNRQNEEEEEEERQQQEEKQTEEKEKEKAKEKEEEYKGTAAPNICIACLGTLQHISTQAFLQSLMAIFPNCGYEFDDYSLTVTLPASTITRQYAVWYHLKSTFGSDVLFEDETLWDSVVEIKEGIKWVLGYVLRHELGLCFSPEALFKVQMTFKHPETEKEHEFLYQIREANLRPHKGRRKGRRAKGSSGVEDASITAIQKALQGLSMQTFMKYGAVPPSPISTCAYYDFAFFHMSIFIAGRYNKYSRALSQSPWMIDGRLNSTTSVSQIIQAVLLDNFKYEDVKFSASGREDVDVRMLGDGRPFVMELINPRKTKYTAQDFIQMQQAINRSTNKIRIRDLQRIKKKDFNKLKDGEEHKSKAYRCVVWAEKELEPKDFDFMKDVKDLKVQQMTPIRVLHRRTLMTREKTVHSLSAQYLSPHFFILDVVTSAGTYVKELVHGDLGRTAPSIGSLLGCETDILQLDVTAIHLDFPPKIPEPTHEEEEGAVEEQQHA